jgi:hypothetical protein
VSFMLVGMARGTILPEALYRSIPHASGDGPPAETSRKTQAFLWGRTGLLRDES